ncbi:MAG: glycosyltransferase [Pseudomonas sp.]|nr:glycosyltransferase [Pseudomonas sp.]
MKILHVIIGLTLGGAELMMKRLIESHSHIPDCEHAVVSLTDLGKIGPQLIDQGISVASLNMHGARDVPQALYKLNRIIRAYRPDIVQTWMYHADLLGGVAARLAGIDRVIWGIRTTDISNGGSKATMVIRTLCARLSRAIPKIIICAADASRTAHARIGYDSNRMIVIPNGFEVSRLQATQQQRDAIRQEAGIGADDLVIGSLGRLNPAKDQENFIAAARILAEKYRNLKFLMIGDGLDPGNRTLMKIITATGHADRFVLLGERRDIPACLKAMDIFCLHSRTEGFPNALGEAMTLGLPCVATNAGDAAYLLGDTGTTVPPRDSQALADGLEKLIRLDHQQRQELGRKSQNRINNNFTIAQTSEKFLQIYDHLIHDDQFREVLK